MNAIELKDAVIIGGGPAGLAAAIALYKKGITNIIVIEREKTLGGILRQCIHDGFGLIRFGKTLSGPEYAQKFIDEMNDLGIPHLINTTVLSISKDKLITTASLVGITRYQAKSVILTMGCRERTRGALAIPGERPAGVFTAGVAQSYINLHNKMIGKNVVILGSGDIGMIMARRMTLEGCKVKAVFEILPYPSGLSRNIEQCLNDYNIPLYLSHTVTEIHGNSRISGVTVSQVDESRNPITGSEKKYACDTLILSVGLIPENELSLEAGVLLDPRTNGAIVDDNYQTSVNGIFAAGNVLHVHDLADFVSMEAENLSDAAAEYILRGTLPKSCININIDKNIGYTIPQKASGAKDFKISLRVRKPFKNCTIEVAQNEKIISSLKIKKAFPAEMIQIPVKKEFLSIKGNMEVCIQC